MSTMIKIQTITVGSGGAANIDFTSIPATYTDLMVKLSLRSNRASVSGPIRLYLNNSSTGVTLRFLQGDGATVASGTESTFSEYIGEVSAATATASVFSSGEIYIPNYTSANYKSVSAEHVGETNATTIYAQMFAWLWSNTAAVNRVTIIDGLGSFVQYSSATLYGIKSS